MIDLNLLALFPEKIKNYEKLPVKLNIFIQNFDLKGEMELVKEGGSKECLLTYMSPLHQLIFRVSNRGEEMTFHAIRMKLIYDEIGPIAGVNEKQEKIQSKNLREALIEFHSWLYKEIN